MFSRFFLCFAEEDEEIVLDVYFCIPVVTRFR